MRWVARANRADGPRVVAPARGRGGAHGPLFRALATLAEAEALLAEAVPPDDDGVCWVSSFGLVGMDMTFYLNSSTTPNLELSGSDGRYMGFRTLRDVAAGEELTFSYQLEK